MQKKAFRKVALERLSSPEQLDQLMQVTSIRGWQVIVVVGLVLAAGLIWSIFGSVKTVVRGNGILVQENLSYIMNASNGLLTAWQVNPGDIVKIGDTVAIVSSPDYSSDLRIISPYAGRISLLKVKQGDYVSAGEPLLAIEGASAATPRLKAILYLPLEASRELRAGMDANLLPLGSRAEEGGYLEGTIEAVSEVPATAQQIVRRTGNVALAGKLLTDDTLVEVVIALKPAEGGSNDGGDGYRWSLPQQASPPIAAGTLCSAEIITSQQAPINLIFAHPRQAAFAAPQQQQHTPVPTPTALP